MKILLVGGLVVLLFIGGYFLVSNRDIEEASSILTREDALTTLYEQYPELIAYETTSLPPSSIVAEEQESGWYFAFVREGSGLPGILDAKCYRVTDTREIVLVGEYTRAENTIAREMNVTTCAPTDETPLSITPPPETKVEPVTPTPKEPSATCYRGGCSGQLCTDEPDMVSTCEYKEEYGCYRDAICERQANGQCGWTSTPALQMCLAAASDSL